jgi:two-component system sensor histidine kinase EvgS
MPLQCVAPVISSQDARIERPDARLRILVIDDHPANLLLMHNS